MKVSEAFWSWLYFAGLGIVLLSLPFWNLGMSIGGFWIAGAWILHTIYLLWQGGSERFSNFKKLQENPVAMVLIGFFLLHVVGLIHTEDYAYAWKDLRIKLPMLFLPVVFPGIPAMTKKQKSWLESGFILAATVASAFISYRFISVDGISFREAHPFVSHIRFGLMVALAGFLCLRRLFLGRSGRIFLIPLLLLIFYLYQMQSITGLITFIAAAFLAGLVYLIRDLRRNRKWLIGALVLLIVLPAGYIAYTANDYFSMEAPPEGSLESHSARGKEYYHNWGDTQVENGNLIWYYISWDELASEWGKRSKIPFAGTDIKGRDLNGTLIRYLSSRGLKKDAEGMSQLSDEDIRRIEMGKTSFKQGQGSGLNRRLEGYYLETNEDV